MTVPSSRNSISEVETLLEQASDLHTLPVVVLEANRLMSDPQTSAQDIANLLSRDPSLAGRILKLANSPYYGFRRRIGNLTQAIVILGFQAVRNLMLTATVIENFGSSNEEFDFSAVWGRSVATAMISQELAGLARSPHADEAYVAGLLHDVGYLFIAQHLPSVAIEVRDRIRDGENRTAVELDVLGYDYAEISSRLIAAWGLPETIVDAIRGHKKPHGDRSEPNAADILHLASVLSALIMEHDGTLFLDPVIGMSQRFGYDPRTLASWIEQIVECLRNAGEFFEILGLGAVQLRGS